MCRATKAMIEEDRNLFILEEAETEPYTGPGSLYLREEDKPWPSWCPQWHIPRSETKAVIPRLGGSWQSTPRSTSRLGWTTLKPCPDLYTLVLEGFLVDTVNHVDFACSVDRAKIRDGMVVSKIFDTEPNTETYPSTTPWMSLSMLVQVLTAGRVLIPADFGTGHDEHTLGELKQQKLFDPFFTPDIDVSSGYNPATIVVTDPFWPSAGRHLFQAHSGRMGLGSNNMRPGDKVVVPFGSSWSFVLSQEAGNWTLVGPCYLQGVDSDEMLTAMEAAGENHQAFNIL